MPKLTMEGLDFRGIPIDIDAKHAKFLRMRDRAYFWTLFLGGCGLFLVSVVLL